MRRQRKKLALVARLWARNQLYTPQDSSHDNQEFDDALAAFGLASQDDGDAPPPEDVCYLWPCNQPAWRVWLAIQTQWRVGMGGREGLHYAGVGFYMREVLRIRVGRHYLEIWNGLLAMEQAALQAWSEMRDQKT